MIISSIFLGAISLGIAFIPEDIFGQWTPEGRVYYLKWTNFKKFLKDNSLIKEHPPESIVIWKKYLIYGAALGVADQVYKSMKLQMPNISDYDDGIFILNGILPACVCQRGRGLGASSHRFINFRRTCCGILCRDILCATVVCLLPRNG